MANFTERRFIVETQDPRTGEWAPIEGYPAVWAFIHTAAEVATHIEARRRVKTRVRIDYCEPSKPIEL